MTMRYINRHYLSIYLWQCKNSCCCAWFQSYNETLS